MSTAASLPENSLADARKSARASARKETPLLGWAIAVVAALAGLYFVFSLYVAGQALWALGALILVALGIAIYATNWSIAARYTYPGLTAIFIFIALPLLFTMQIGFTNYSSNNLLTFDRATAYLLEQTTADEASVHEFSLHRPSDSMLAAVLVNPKTGEKFTSQLIYGSDIEKPIPTTITPHSLGEGLSIRERIAMRDYIKRMQFAMPNGDVLSYAGLREFAKVTPVWKQNADGSLTRSEDGEVFKPNDKTGYYENASGDKLTPGYTVNVGFANYARMINDENFRAPFISIFIWTLVFALLSVFFVTALGTTLAVILNWEALKGATIYRTLLFLPYAVPGFISILVFKGLFNHNFGEINTILNAVFGIKPAWFADPLLAKVMLLIVNVWLGFPYIMVLCTGLIKSIPADLYEASAIAGAGPLTNFFKITLPLIIKPLAPLLVGVFAFNFNNFVLIALLTDGRPDFLNTKVPAGTNDILVSYTYRIAFKDSGSDFGLAAAISTVVFFMVAVMALLHLRLMKANQGTR
ncbi:MAG: maltose ABC transporter permease MalF [Casimicrobium sp.]